MVKEIRNKAFRALMKKEGLEKIHLYREAEQGYHYIWSDKDCTLPFRDTIIYLPYFNQQSIEMWVRDIKHLIGEF